jgi:uncharacterized protein (TIGR02145 family)
MKNIFRISGVVILVLLIILIHSCKKDKPTPPIITTTAISVITQTTATSGGNITSDGGATVTARGVCWSTTTGPTAALSTKTTDNTGTGTFTSSITALTAGTVYYVRAYATNVAGTAYGNEISFTSTASTVPVLTTTAASAITQTTATSGGNITSDGGATVTARGVCWSTTTGPTAALSTKTTDNTGTGTFTSSITALTAGTVYYVRAYATNVAGTAYGNEISFITSVTDIDGNTYNTVTIGTQVWMAENLKTTKYNDGTAIPNITDNAAWVALTTPAYCWYNNNAATYKATYGAMYNWYTVDVASNGGKNVCPTSWHVSTDAEWTTLTTYLGGGSVAGGKLKETGTTHWTTPNTGATNETGFTALPGGYRNNYGTCSYIGINGHWWSSSEGSTTYAWYSYMYYNYTNVYRDFYYGKYYGFSVRCVRDF